MASTPSPSASPTAAELLAVTPLLDHTSPQIQTLLASRGWLALDDYQRIGAAYHFVRDEIRFGYNRSDDLPASQVLADGLGQCNTKGTLLMALLRALGIACRLHGFTVDKRLQRGVVPALVYLLAPRQILHSWVEIYWDGRWLALEGYILDQPYLQMLQDRFSVRPGRFCGYGAAVDDLQLANTDWRGEETYIQRGAISADLGLFASPDLFYQQQGTNLSGARRWLYQHGIRHWMNRKVRQIRIGRLSNAPAGC